jgi:hypothetical protein
MKVTITLHTNLNALHRIHIEIVFAMRYAWEVNHLFALLFLGN